MPPDTRAGDFAGCTANLESIARFHLARPVRVVWRHAVPWLGLARRAEAGPVIELNADAPAGDLGHIFMHELAHHVHGHVTMVTPAGYEAADTDAILARLSPLEAAGVQAVIDQREAEADTWACAALASFEARFGDFLTAIGGG